MATKSHSKIPLRGIAALFNHLPPGVKSQLQAAFAEAEDLMDYHSRSAVDKQERRSLSSLVDSPVLSHTTNNRGFDVTWDRLEDRRIQNYQVQVSFDSTFPNPDTYNVVDTCFALEGLGTTVFVRVRAVRFSGECGPWSDVEQINAFATSAGPVVYTRGLDDIPSFYVDGSIVTAPGPMQHINITPQRQNGGILVFGSCDQPTTVTLNSSLMSASNGGGFGPAFLAHSDFYFSRADGTFPSTAAQSGAGSGTFTGWTNLTNATGTMETDFSGALATDYLQSLVAGQSVNSKHLKLTNFGFTVPSGNTITGIQVKFTGEWAGGDPAKSTPQIKLFSLIDGGTTRTYSHSTTFPWAGPGYALGFIPTSGTISSVTFGDSADLWGEVAGFWTAAKVNSATFGLDLVARLRRGSTDTTTQDQQVVLYGMTITVFSTNASLTARVEVFTTGPVLNCTLNVVEFGQQIT